MSHDRRIHYTPANYDKNGNIRSLFRTDANGGQLHKLEYSYNGNQLSSIKVNNAQPATFTYDANGNMTHDGHTGVNIVYNILDLPERVFAGTQEVRYIYDATGAKLATVAANGSLTYYRSVFTYAARSSGASEELIHVLHPEGLVSKGTGGWSYMYFKTDHVGSTRVVLEANGTGLTERQRTDFYPFGLAHGMQINNLQQNKYLYGGKEYQDQMLGTAVLGLYDFHARYYNPMYGRWFNIDPALQATNPYLYCANSPMMYVDPDGEFWELLIFAAFSSGAMNLTMNADKVDNFWDGLGYFASGAAVGAVSAGLGAFAPTNVIWSTLYNAGLGSLMSGAQAALNGVNGKELGRSFLSGAISGGISGFLSSEEVTNLVKGGGFRSNDYVLKRFASNGQYQEALNYFGFKGTYDPNSMFFAGKHSDAPGVTDMTNGNIFYNSPAFDKGYDFLYSTSDHEFGHYLDFISKRYPLDELASEKSYAIMYIKAQGIKDEMEYNNYLRSYKRQGLYHNYGKYLYPDQEIEYYLNYFGPRSSIFQLQNRMYRTPYPDFDLKFQKKWHDFIYKIPRRY